MDQNIKSRPENINLKNVVMLSYIMVKKKRVPMPLSILQTCLVIIQKDRVSEQYFLHYGQSDIG